MGRTTQDVIASFPRRVVCDGKGLFLKSRFIIVAPGEPGYSPLEGRDDWTLERLDEIIGRAWDTRAPTPQEREAALIGSMFGWHTPGADPELYVLKVEFKGDKQ